MAASAWTVFNRAKHKIGNGTINLGGGKYRLTLHRTSASAKLSGQPSIFTSVGFESSGGGYSDYLLSNVAWTGAASANSTTRKFDCTDPVITASSSVLSAVRYAVLRYSAGAASGHLLCYAALSTAQFDVGSGNTLTIQMNASGIFTLT